MENGAVSGVNCTGLARPAKTAEPAKYKEEPKKFLGWANGFNTNQLQGLLNGTLSTTASQG